MFGLLINLETQRFINWWLNDMMLDFESEGCGFNSCLSYCFCLKGNWKVSISDEGV